VLKSIRACVQVTQCRSKACIQPNVLDCCSKISAEHSCSAHERMTAKSSPKIVGSKFWSRYAPVIRSRRLSCPQRLQDPCSHGCCGDSFSTSRSDNSSTEGAQITRGDSLAITTVDLLYVGFASPFIMCCCVEVLGVQQYHSKHQ
jgi:hypothetical protein